MLTAARFASRLVESHGDLIVKRSFSTLLNNVSKRKEHYCAYKVNAVYASHGEFDF